MKHKVTNKRALIVGLGYLGTHLMKTLRRHGWQVTGIRRSFVQDDDVLSLDLLNPFSLMQSFDTVIFLVSPNSSQENNAYLLSLQHTLEALQRISDKQPRILFASSIGVYGENKGGWVNESSSPDSQSSKSVLLKKAEAMVQQSGFETVIIRFAGIYGPQRLRIIEQLRRGCVFLKRQPVVSNRIHRDDCCGILLHLATIEQVAPLYIAVDSNPTPYNDMVSWICQRYDFSLPKMEDEAKGVEYSRMLNRYCSNKKLLQYGYEFKYPSYQEGLDAEN